MTMRNEYELVPFDCAVRALAGYVFNDGHSAPQVTVPSPKYLDQCVTAFNAAYEAAAGVHAAVGDVNVDRVQLAANDAFADATHELSEFE